MEKIEKYFESKYDKSRYLELNSKLKDDWGEINNEFFSAISEILDIKPLDKYFAQITLYGPGGSYLLPNRVIIRAAIEEDIKHSISNLAHEIVHLMVEKPIVAKYKLDQEEKENLVNFLFSAPSLRKVLPNYRIPFRHKELPKKVSGKIKINF